MKHIVYLRSGRIIEIEAETVKCVDQKARVYKFYGRDDEDTLTLKVTAIANDPELILTPLNQSK